MYFATFSVIVAVVLVSVESSTFQYKRYRSAYIAALKCTKAGWDADVAALTSGEGPSNEEEILEDACIYLREFARCIINTDPAEYALPVPNIVHFLVAYEWQHLYIAKKAGLCDNMPTKGLKRIAVNSGIMRKEHLENVENDEFAKCVGDAMQKCMMRAEYLMKKGISQDFLAAMTDYITCYEKEGYNCDKKMMRDYVNIMKAYRKHLEEKHGEYGKMVNKIELIKT